MNQNIFEELENISVNGHQNKFLGSTRKDGRMKLNALGDVQNTLHSRSAKFIASDNPVKSAIHKKNSHSKERNWNQSVHEKKINSVQQNLNDKPDEFETHNHALCEEAEKNIVNDLFIDYKLSDKQIDTLVRSVKHLNFFMPLKPMEFSPPCEDIEFPQEEELMEENFSINGVFSDIFSDIELGNIPPPIEIL